MKKGNRVLALFLAIAMVFTSIAWDFSKAEAAETESAATEGGHVKYDFESITDVSSLDSAFTAYQKNAVTPDASVADYWFIGKTGTDAEESDVEGLKPKKKGAVYCLVHNRTYKEFKLTVEMYPDTNTQVGIGQVTSSGVSQTTPGSLMIWFSTNKVLNYAGMGKKGSATLSGSQTVYAVNIRVENGTVTIWVDGEDFSANIDVDDSFPEQSNIVFRQQRNSDYGKGGGYKSLEIRDLTVEGYTDFDHVDVSTLTNFTSTKFKDNAAVEGDTDVAVSNHWFSSTSGTTTGGTEVTSNSVGLKTRDAEVYNLNYATPYKNFKMSLEMHNCKNQGIVIGDANQRAVDASKPALNVWVDGTKFNIRGAHDYANASNEGGTLTRATSSGGITSFNVGTLTDIFELNVEVSEGVFKLWVTGYDAYLTIPLGAAYPSESTIALWAKRDGANGGFKSLTVENLDDAYVSFDDVDVTTLNEYFTSTQMTEDSTSGDPVIEGQQDVAVENHWSTTASTVAGIKPITHRDDHKHNLLKYNEVYKNFEATIKFTWNTNIGFVIGDAYTYPYTSTTDAILLVTNKANLKVRGAIDTSTASVEGTIQKNTITPNQCEVQMASSNLDTSLQTIHIRLLDGVLTIWLDSSDEVLTVKVASTYPNASNISLWALGYSNNNSFINFQINNLGDTCINFDNISLSKLDEKGYTSTRFTRPGSGNYALKGEADQSVSNHWFTGTDYSADYINAGLKPNTKDNDNMTHLNTPNTYKNFRVSAEIYWGYGAGIVIGEKNVYPNDSSASAIRINFTGTTNLLRVIGAVDYSRGTATGTNAKWSVTESGTSVYGGFTFTGESLTKGEAYTLNVEMKDGVLSVWVDGYDGVLTVKVADTYPVSESSIALLASKYNGDGGGLKSFTINGIDTLSKGYTPIEFATYRSEDEYTVPSYHDYLFAGWFYDEACEEPVEKDVTTVTRCVYAKFVSSDILDVKAQISGNLYDTNGTNDKSGSIRFITTVDSLDYNKIGFKVSYDKGDGKGVRNVTSASNKVYKKLYAVGSTEGEDTEYTPSSFCPASTYFKACTVPDIIEDYYNVEFTVTSFWKTLDGTIVDGETVVKKINDKRIVSSVYVSDNGSDTTGLGTYNYPYATLNHSIEQVADKGIVYVVDKYTGANDWEDHDKTITITSAVNDEGTLATLDYTGLPKSTTTIDRSTLNIKDSVTFEKIEIAFTDEKFTQNDTNYTVRTSVFAWGNPITIAEDVEMTGNAIRILGAGYSSATVDRTELNLYAGTYMEIYGGGMSGTVTGDTNITIGPKVNPDVDPASHDHYYMLFGGGYDGTVNKNTNITIAEGANFAYIYGAGYGANTKVLGTTNIDFKGNAFSIYGGSYYGTNGDTNVVINDGTVYQIFGGCEANSMEGNTNIKVVKGDVLRRIYGGCYNDYDTKYLTSTGSLWGSSYHINGDANIKIYKEANLSLNVGTEYGLLAVSRHKDTDANERGTLIFNDGTYTTWKSKIGSNSFSMQPYHYLVDASENGEVVSVVDGALTLAADTGYTATVTYGDSNTVIEVNEDGTYTLPTVDKDSKIIITVTFSK